MPWKKIGKIISAVVIGGGVASGAPADALSLSISPEMLQAIQALIGAIVTLVALFSKTPKETE